MNTPLTRNARLLGLAVLAASSLPFLSNPACAATKTYEGPNNGNWNLASNWSPLGLPSGTGNGDDVFLGTFKPAGVTSDLDVTFNTMAPGSGFNSVTLNSSALPGFMVLNETTGGTLYATTENIGTTTNENTFNQSGGSSNYVSTLNIGVSSFNNNYNISGANTSLQTNGNLTVGVSGGGSFTQSGGNVYIYNGALVLGANASSSGTYTLSSGSFYTAGFAVVGSAGSGTFTQSGSSSFECFVLYVSSTSGTAAFNYSGGTILIDAGPGEFQIGTNGTFNLQSGGSLALVPTVNPGGTFNMVGGTFAPGGGVDLAGGTFQLQGNSVTTSSFGGGAGIVQNGGLLAAVLTVNEGNQGSQFLGVMQDGPSGTLGLTIANTQGGIFGVKGQNTYSGPTTIQSGTLQALANNTLSPNSAVTLTGGTLDLQTFSATILSLAGTGGTVNIGAGGLLSIAGNGSTVYAGTFTGNGTLSKSGSGNLTLTGGGTFTGSISVQGGAVTVAAVNGIPTGATVNLGPIGGALNVNANQSLAAFSSGDSGITTFTGNSTLTVGTGNVDSFVGANFSGAGTFVKVGTANLTLGYGASDIFANPDASLTISVNAGTLVLAKANGTVAVAGPLVLTGGTVLFNASSQTSPSSTVTLTGGTFNLNGFTDTIGGLAGASGNVALSGGTLTVAQATNGSSGAVLTGPGTLIKTGLGNLSLTATSSYNGAVFSNAGRLLLFNNASASSYIANSGGTIQFNSANLNVPGIQLLANAGGAFEYLGANVSNAFLRGSGTHVILAGATSTFNGVTTYNSTTITQNGPALLNNFTNGGTINNNANLALSGGTNNTSGIINVNSSFTTQDFTNNGVINIAPGATLANSGSNLFLGGGARMYIGTKAAPGGNLTLQGGTTLEVNGALLINDGTISGTTDVNFGGQAQGIGTYGPVNVSFGGTFQPGFASATFPGNSATVSQLSGNGTIDNTSTGNMTLTLTGNSVSAFSGPIQNSNGTTTLNITGTSSLTLSTTPLSGGGNSTNTYSGGTTISNGASLIIAATGALPSGQPISNDGNFSVNANSTAGQLSGLGTATLGNNITLTLSQNTGASKQGALILNTNAQLNLTTNPLVIEAPNPVTKATFMSQLATQVATGRNGGTWNGPGITSTTVQSNPSQLSIAIADNALLNRTTIGGQSVDSNSILVVPAYFGDANLDGHVDLTDLSTILNNFGSTTGAWTSGNFDGGAQIDLTDLSDVLNNFGLTNPNASTANTVMPASPAPEPSSLLLLGLTGVLLVHGRASRQKRNAFS